MADGANKSTPQLRLPIGKQAAEPTSFSSQRRIVSQPTSSLPRDGDWSAWLAEQGPRLLLAARQYLASLADAEDVVQEAFILSGCWGWRCC